MRASRGLKWENKMYKLKRSITYKYVRLFYLYYAQYNRQSFNVFQALSHKLSSATYGYFFGLKVQAKRAKLFHNSRSSK